MGHPVGEPAYGADCPDCTPGVFAVGETPLEMYMLVQGIVKCPAAGPRAIPDGTFIVTQNDILPCLWSDVPLNIIYNPAAPGTLFRIQDPPGFWFNKFEISICEDFANNGLLACGPANIYGILGTIRVDQRPVGEIPWLLTNTYNFCPVEETFYEHWLLPTAAPYQSVTRLANIRYDTNVLVKFQPP